MIHAVRAVSATTIPSVPAVTSHIIYTPIYLLVFQRAINHFTQMALTVYHAIQTVLLATTRLYLIAPCKIVFKIK